MRARGLEPPRAFARRDLNPPRLPIPPRPRVPNDNRAGTTEPVSDDDQLPEGATGPQPERGEPQLADPRLRDLTFRDWKAILLRSAQAGERRRDHGHRRDARLLRLPRDPGCAPDRGRRLQPHGRAGHDRVDDRPPHRSRSGRGAPAHRGKPRPRDGEQERRGRPHRPRLPARPLDGDGRHERPHPRPQPRLRPRGDEELHQAAPDRAHHARLPAARLRALLRAPRDGPGHLGGAGRGSGPRGRVRLDLVDGRVADPPPGAPLSSSPPSSTSGRTSPTRAGASSRPARSSPSPSGSSPRASSPCT